MDSWNSLFFCKIKSDPGTVVIYNSKIFYISLLMTRHDICINRAGEPEPGVCFWLLGAGAA